LITCGYVSVDEINKLHLSKLIKDVCSTLRPIGVVGGGSIPLAIVGSIALLLTLLHYVSSRLVSLVNEYNKEVSMVKTLTARTRVFLSSTFETIWAIGVSSVTGTGSCLLA